MSTSDLYILNKKSTTHFRGFRNGWGSGPVCWDYLAKKYGVPSSMFDMNPVWALASGGRLAHHERVAMMMTFDAAYVPMGKLQDAAESCERFGAESEDGARANHWTAFGAALRDAAKQRHNRFARGICLSCTSVSDNWGYGSDWPDKAWSIYDEDTQE
ncbi:MAG: hypothetical protein QM523_00945 [Candidatus Pacebacteria bacterium]|nr:hypothetical protein [Candidatus Paceibacterota bacterium]